MAPAVRTYRPAQLLILFSSLALVRPVCFAQHPTETSRKVVNRVTPTYPDLARAINLKGNVTIDVVVAANGTVKSLQVKGGNPVLVQAAENAIRKWKWEPASHETVEPIEVRFDPQ
jgi:TonB family protein